MHSVARLARALPIALCLLPGCSADEGSLGEPSVKAEPVDPMTLEFVNPGAEDVYVEYPGNQPGFVLERNDTELMTHRGCLPFCEEGCACSPCSPAATQVRRVPAEESVTVTWEPVHYAVNACNGSSDCSCVERWPVTAGHYEITLTGFTAAEGGQPVSGDPNLLSGARPSDRSRTCTARGSFDLEGGGTMSAKLICP